MWHYLKLTLMFVAYAALAFNALVIAVGAIHVAGSNSSEGSKRTPLVLSDELRS